MEYLPEELVEINPRDARKLKVRERDPVKVITPRGEVIARAHITTRVSPGIIFMDFHFEDPLTNLITSPAIDTEVHTPEYKAACARIVKL